MHAHHDDEIEDHDKGLVFEGYVVSLQVGIGV